MSIGLFFFTLFIYFVSPPLFFKTHNSDPLPKSALLCFYLSTKYVIVSFLSIVGTSISTFMIVLFLESKESQSLEATLEFSLTNNYVGYVYVLPNITFGVQTLEALFLLIIVLFIRESTTLSFNWLQFDLVLEYFEVSLEFY